MVSLCVFFIFVSEAVYKKTERRQEHDKKKADFIFDGHSIDHTSFIVLH
jgi:hypothetical protein